MILSLTDAKTQWFESHHVLQIKMAKIARMLIWKRIGEKQLLGAARPTFKCNPHALVQKVHKIREPIIQHSPQSNISQLVENWEKKSIICFICIKQTHINGTFYFKPLYMPESD